VCLPRSAAHQRHFLHQSGATVDGGETHDVIGLVHHPPALPVITHWAHCISVVVTCSRGSTSGLSILVLDVQGHALVAIEGRAKEDEGHELSLGLLLRGCRAEHILEYQYAERNVDRLARRLNLEAQFE
jgi:hypothetical protein